MMRTALGVLMLGLTLVATAAANPIGIDLFVDFEPPYAMTSIYPAPYTTVFAYVVADIGYITGEDVYSVSFDASVTEGTGVMVDFTPIDPSYIVLGIVGDGITVIAEDCFTQFPATLGYVHIFYLGMPGIVEIVPHPYLGHVFTTCGDPGSEHEYCYVQGGGIGMYAPEPLILCDHNPVSDVAWGAIKALYR
jgi:hypothetical protein